MGIPVLWRRASGAVLAAKIAGDPYWDNVINLLHFDGADGATVITDETGRPWSAVGEAHIVADGGAFGGAALLPGTAGSVLSGDPKEDYTFLHDGSTWTVEGFLTSTELGASATFVINNKGTTNAVGLWLGVLADGSVRALMTRNVDKSPVLEFTSTVKLVTGRRYHVAYVHDQSRALDLEVWLDGVSLGGSNATNAYPAVAPSHPFCIGGDHEGLFPFKGQLDEWRITKDMARYTDDFTPPSEPFPS